MIGLATTTVYHMAQECTTTTSILAGNSRVSLSSDGVITVEPQLRAFKTAVAYAAYVREKGLAAHISLALDHRGIFRKQFLKEGLSNSAKRNPKLSQIRHEIADVFSPIALEHDIDPSLIAVIHEDSARTHASFVLNSFQCHPLAKRMMQVPDHDDEPRQGGCDALGGSCSYGPRDVDRVTCAAVTAEYYAKAIEFGHNPSRLEVFIEDDPWSSVPVFIRGAVLLPALGIRCQVGLNLVYKNGWMATSRKAACL